MANALIAKMDSIRLDTPANRSVVMELKLIVKNAMMVIYRMVMDVVINAQLKKILFAKHHQIFQVAK